MERNQKIEAIRKACIKANPEIVELKFGCQIKVIDEDIFGEIFRSGSKSKKPITDNDIKDLFAIEEARFFNLISYEEYGESVNVAVSPSYDIPGMVVVMDDKGMWEEVTFEVIGRPIWIADVLLALNRIDYNTSYEVEGDRFWFPEEDEQGDWNTTAVEWNLRKDSLDNQPDATIDFLFSLLEEDKE